MNTDLYIPSVKVVQMKMVKTKGESLQIPFKERLTSPKLAEVAEFKNSSLILKNLDEDTNCRIWQISFMRVVS